MLLCGLLATKSWYATDSFPDSCTLDAQSLALIYVYFSKIIDQLGVEDVLLTNEVHCANNTYQTLSVIIIWEILTDF